MRKNWKLSNTWVNFWKRRLNNLQCMFGMIRIQSYSKDQLWAEWYNFFNCDVSILMTYYQVGLKNMKKSINQSSFIDLFFDLILILIVYCKFFFLFEIISLRERGSTARLQDLVKHGLYEGTLRSYYNQDPHYNKINLMPHWYLFT